MSIKIFVILELNNFSCCWNVLLTIILKGRVAVSQSMIRLEKYMRIAHLWLTFDILYCSWCRCKYGSISGLFSWIFCTTISHDKFDYSPYGAGYKSTGGKFWEFFFIPLLKGYLVYWSTKYFLFSHYSSFSKLWFPLLQQSCLQTHDSFA